jgi:DNA-binding response OmpR family regulator
MPGRSSAIERVSERSTLALRRNVGAPSVARMGTPELGPILVVEDDPSIRELLCDAFRGDGLDVVPAADGEDAIEAARAQRPAAVILDIGLPRVDGAGVAGAIQEKYGDSVPLIIVTAGGRMAEVSSRVRAAAYFTKPFDIAELTRAVRAAITPPASGAPEGSPAVAG